ncbi:MAG: TerB N-terminal domain-containing protein [Rhodobacteraceae bacterium]|nr:TerB N-terminal domain-containing protein [Paracoccaceae bacterium]
MKFVRVVFFYALYFILCMFVVVIFFESWPVGAQMLFAFVSPAIWVWWRERRRAQKQAVKLAVETLDRPISVEVPKALKQDRKGKVVTQIKDKKTASQFLNQYENRVEKKHGAIREWQAVREAKPLSGSTGRKPGAGPSRKKSRLKQQGWVLEGLGVSVAGRDIGGMVYVGTPPLLNDHGYRNKCRAYIDPSLSVARHGADKAGDGMPYWPGYSDISSRCRATYLDWLAGGRSDVSYNPGYMFLYFYGLERRFFVDDLSLKEKLEIRSEVERLAHLYSENHSVRRYLSEFVQLAQVATTDVNDLQPVFDPVGWELPFTVKLAIGARLDKGETLDAKWVLSWLLCHPERRMRGVSTRCNKEFHALFELRFNAKYPEGLKVSKPRKILDARYQAASSEFEGTLNPTVDGKAVSDISGLRKPVKVAQEIADEVMGDLDKFSRYLGRNPDGRGSLEAQALLPSELWPLFPSEEFEKLKFWARDIVEAGGVTPVIDIIARLEGTQPGKLTKRQLTGAADALARIGFGFAPDPRFALRSPKISEPVVIFDLGGAVEQLEDVSPIYRTALIELALGSFVAQADGHVADAERKALLDRITKTKGLTEQECRRLLANRDWLLTVPPDMTLLRRKLKETGLENQAAFRVALVSAAHADGIIRSEEVAGIEKLYKVLGLDPALVYSDLHAGDVQNGPIRVKAAQSGAPGEVIPEERTSSPAILDAARIAAIRSDTERVSSVLGEIFAGDMEEPQEEGFPSSFKGLDGKHAALVREIVAQQHWTDEAFGNLCGKHGLMTSGAMETVNEWAFEIYDEALLDEYDGYDVTPEIVDVLTKEFEKEGRHVQIETP